MRSRGLLLAGTVIGLAIVALFAGSLMVEKYEIEETLLDYWPFYPSGYTDSIAVSERYGHVAYPTKAWIQWGVAIDGVIGSAHDHIVKGSIVLSPDGSRVAYAAVDDDNLYVILDDKRLPGYDGVGGLTFSRDGRRLAYGAKCGDKQRMIVDGKPSVEYDSVELPVFSIDGEHVAYTAVRDKARFLVVDGKRGPACDLAGLPVLSADGKRLAYAEKREKMLVVVVDGQQGPEYDDFGQIIFSPDGKHVAYCALKGKKWVVVMDGQPGLEYDGIGEKSLGFSPDGRHLAYCALKGKKWVVVMDGQQGPEYDSIAALVFSADGKHVVYTAEKSKKSGESVLVVDGKARASYDGIQRLTFSPDGNHLAYVAFVDGDEHCVVVDGKAGQTFKIDKGGYLVRGLFDDEPLVFSPDGKHLAYVVSTLGGESHNEELVVMDGKMGPKYHAVIPRSVVIRQNGCLEYLAVQYEDPNVFGSLGSSKGKNDKLFRVKHTPRSWAARMGCAVKTILGQGKESG